MLVGPGANTTVQIGRDGVFVVDPQTGAASASLLAAIRRLSDKPVRFIVNTTIDADHIGGNEAIAKSGQTLAGGTRGRRRRRAPAVRRCSPTRTC